MDDDEICEAYVYLLGRLLVLRQQRFDLERDGLAWNRLIHRGPGDVAWANPNLDVVYSEAWLALDRSGGVLVEIPRIEDRYYTWQMLNGWGETLLNVNDRTFPNHPHGRYAICLAGSTVTAPDDAVRIEVPSHTVRVLARVALGDDSETAIRLQNAFTLTPFGDPKPPVPIDAPSFDNRRLPGVEAFDAVPAILAADDDINPGMGEVRAVCARIHDLIRSGPRVRDRVDRVIAEQAVPALRRRTTTVGRTIDGWICPDIIGNYGADYWTRTVANLAGIWANSLGEYASFIAIGLDGGSTYTLTYPTDRPPRSTVEYFWSVTAIDSRDFRVLANPLERHVLNDQANLSYNVDGSLTLAFGPEPPAGHPAANWLPTLPGTRFNLTYRLYGQRDPRYVPPPLRRLPAQA